MNSFQIFVRLLDNSTIMLEPCFPHTTILQVKEMVVFKKKLEGGIADLRLVCDEINYFN